MTGGVDRDQAADPIQSGHHHVRTGRDGRPAERRSYYWRPRVVEISIPGEGHYKEGLYTLSAQSFRPDKYERLEMAYPTLTPLEEALKIAEQANKAWKSRKLA